MATEPTAHREPIWVTEHDVVELLDLPSAVDVVEQAFRAEAAGVVAGMDKTHVAWGDGHTLHAIGGVDEQNGLVATKTWAHTAGGATPLLLVWSAASGELQAVVEAFALGQLRTGAVSGVATRHLAVPDARELAVVGSGRQALAQVAAVAAVRALDRVRVFSPTEAHRLAFVERVEKLDLGCAVEASSSVAEAVAGAHVVTTVTRARRPFLDAAMPAPGTHVNAVGAITPERRELAPDVLERADVVVVDSVAAARRLAVELTPVAELTRLCDVVAADGFDRGHDLTVFKAMGVGIADLALGAEVLALARAAGCGRPFPAPERATPRLT